MSEQSFTSHLSSWRQSQTGNTGSPGLAAPPPPPGSSFFSGVSSWNPFGDRIRLPLTEREEPQVQEPEWFNLSRFERLSVFGLCLLGAVACFTLCFVLMPVLALKPRKFATLWTLGSLLFVISFGVLQGPVSYTMHLISPDRLPFTVAFFGSIFMTLYFSIGLHSTILTLVATIIQAAAAIWYTVSYFPMGAQSLKFASRVGARQVNSWINS